MFWEMCSLARFPVDKAAQLITSTTVSSSVIQMEVMRARTRWIRILVIISECHPAA